jgi:hypothetical protein
VYTAYNLLGLSDVRCIVADALLYSAAVSVAQRSRHEPEPCDSA